MKIKKYLEENTKRSSTRLKSFIWCIVFVIIDLALQTSLCLSLLNNAMLLKEIPFLVFILVDIMIHFIAMFYPQYLQKIIEMGVNKWGK